MSVRPRVRRTCCGRARPCRRGFGVVEAVVAVTLTGLLLSLVVGTAASARRSLERLARASERIEAARLARTLADRVTAADSPGVPVAGREEVRVRLPVGWAEPCDSVFRWAGIRAPDPLRDSAIVVGRGGRVRTVALVAAPERACASGAGRTFQTDPAVPDVVLVRVFEAGVIRVDDAVRYARWGTPRQPLTAASLDPAASGVERVAEGLRVHLRGREGRGFDRIWWGR